MNIYMGGHVEDRLLERNLLGKCGVFWSQLDADIEALWLHLVITTYVESEILKGKSEYWMMVITMVGLLCSELIKVLVGLETSYGSDEPAVMVVQYLWVTLQ